MSCFLTWCIPTSLENKSVKIWTQLVIEIMCFQMQYLKGFRPEVFYDLSGKLSLFKNYVTSNGAVSDKVLYYY